MNKTTYLGIIGLFILTVLGVYAYKGILPQVIESVTSRVQPLIGMVQPALTKAQATWATIPPSIQQIIMLGIPSAFAMFFAWTKLRVIDSAKQAQTQATAAFTQVSGEASEYKQQLEQVTTERDSFKTQLGQQPNLGFEDLTKARDEAQKMVTVKAKELGDVQAVVRSQKTYIEELLRKIEEQKTPIYP